MTLIERLEEIGERLIHPHHEHDRAIERRMRGTEDRHEHLVHGDRGQLRRRGVPRERRVEAVAEGAQADQRGAGMNVGSPAMRERVPRRISASVSDKSSG